MASMLLFSISLVVFFYMNHISMAIKDSAYIPKQHILVNCGASGRSMDDDKRTWVGDIRSEFMPSSGEAATVRQHSLPQLPYTTARVSKAQFVYSILVSSRCMFLRLYFYPSNYSNYLASNALFNVTTSGNFTLLESFNPSLDMMDAHNQSYHFREFSINTPSSGYLDIFFTPCSNASHAFVNGVEIVTMPNDMFVTAYPLYDSESLYGANANVVLETMYRLNVGGPFIPPAEDSGEFRRWYNDTPYVYKAGMGMVYAKDPNVTITYLSTVPKYIGPSGVYGTARSRGSLASNATISYNLAWVFLVDPGYLYWVRLHFCEIRDTISRENARAFRIFINNRTTDAATDVMDSRTWDGTPVYRDFVLQISNATSQQQLSVSLRPSNTSNPFRSDPILNGVEVFKLRNTKGIITRLIAPSPSNDNAMPETRGPVASPPSNGNSRSVLLVVGGVVGGVLLLVFMFFLKCCFRRRARAAAMGNSLNGSSIAGTSNLCRYFRFTEMEAATNNFDESSLLGVGGFGKVYLGTIDAGSVKVAIKRANPMSKQGIQEFQTEIELLSKLRHRHLVSLIGYCDEKREMILVYDYMASGSLREHLYNAHKPSLPWKQRLEICIGAARGLHYLHTGAKQSIIHRDVKTTNILLDDNLVAKVSDFGLSRIRPATLENDHVSTVVKGSFGYIDPEYVRRQRLTEKSDVYSFGVVLFEVLCARPAVNSSLPEEQVNLASWALECRKQGKMEEIIDPYLKDHTIVGKQCLEKFVEIAGKCLADKWNERPNMADVLWNLEVALQLQESDSPSQSIKYGIRSEVVRTEVQYFDGLTPSGIHSVFSDTKNPQGR